MIEYELIQTFGLGAVLVFVAVLTFRTWLADRGEVAVQSATARANTANAAADTHTAINDIAMTMLANQTRHQQQMDGLRDRLDKIHDKYTDERLRAAALERELKDTREKLALVLQESNERDEAMKQQVASLKDRVAHLETELKKMKELNEQYRERYEQERESRERLERELKARDERIAALEQRIEELTREKEAKDTGESND